MLFLIFITSTISILGIKGKKTILSVKDFRQEVEKLNDDCMADFMTT